MVDKQWWQGLIGHGYSHLSYLIGTVKWSDVIQLTCMDNSPHYASAFKKAASDDQLSYVQIFPDYDTNSVWYTWEALIITYE